MSILKPVTDEVAYVKISGFGFAGTGKTWTSSLIAEGLHKRIGSKKPIAFFDSEGGLTFVNKKIFEPSSIPVVAVKSKSFADLMRFMNDAEKECDIAIIDSVTHVWADLLESYKAKKGRDRLYIPDWGILKPQWWKFSDRVVRSKLHLIVLGRAGYEYETSTDEETGKKESYRSGTKMKAEGDFSFEPSLNLEFVKFRPTEKVMVKDYGVGEYIANKKIGLHDWVRVCTVHKDRWNEMDGKNIVKPTYKDFEAHIENYNFGGEHKPLEQIEDSKDLFKNEDDGRLEKTRREILLEKIQAEIIYICGAGTAGKVKEEKIKLFDNVFGTTSWTEVCGFETDQLERSLDILFHTRKAKDAQEQKEVT